MSRRSGSSLSIPQGVDGIEDQSATQKYSAIDKLFCSDFERTAEIRYPYARKPIRTLQGLGPRLAEPSYSHFIENGLGYPAFSVKSRGKI
jgi:hypothetical protein